MLRECVRHEHLAKILLHSDDFYNFFNYVEVSTFDIASDAFSTFKVIIPCGGDDRVAGPNK
jgi:calcium binding protein 39